MNGLRVFRKIATAQRRQMSTKDMFENTNKISNVRKTWYSNPEAGKSYQHWQKLKFEFFSTVINWFLFSLFSSGAANPTYLKEGSDKIVTGVAITLVSVGVLCILNSVNNMSFGINKK